MTVAQKKERENENERAEKGDREREREREREKEIGKKWINYMETILVVISFAYPLKT